MPELQRRRLWLGLGWCLVALVLLLSLMPNPPMPGIRFADKFGHLLAYAALMLWFGQLHRRRWLSALLLLAMGVAVEFLQGLSGRWFELEDMLANGLGVALAWALLTLTPLGRLFVWLELRLAAE